MPSYEPRWDYINSWQWTYRVAFHHAQGSYVYKERKDGYLIGTYDFSLIDASLSGPNWDNTTMRHTSRARARICMSPPATILICALAATGRRYECDTCKKFVTPFSNDQGDIVCPYCEVSGLVILDEAQLDRLEQTREFAREHGLSEQLERQLHYLANYADHGEGATPVRVVL